MTPRRGNPSQGQTGQGLRISKENTTTVKDYTTDSSICQENNNNPDNLDNLGSNIVPARANNILYLPRPKNLFVETDSGMKIVERIQAVAEREDLSNLEARVLMYIITKIGVNGYCILSITKLATKLNKSRSPISVVLKKLIENDWITLERYSKTKSFYGLGFRFTKDSLPEDLPLFIEKYKKDGCYDPGCIFTKAERAEMWH